MIKIAIVDDDDKAALQLEEYISDYRKKHGEEIAVARYSDGDEIVREYKSQFDIILMDIQMKFMDGMGAAEEIRKLDSEVAIIFITNMTQYAIQGYKINALDYLTKPVSCFAFQESLGRAIARINKKTRNIVMIPVKGGVVRLDVADIYYVESQGHNLIYYTGKGNYTSSGTIKSAEDILASYGFSRGNKGYLINLAYVEAVQDQCAEIKGTKLPLSRPRRNSFMKDLTKYWGEYK